MPIRPTVRRWPAPAMPATSVAKISGAMIILIIRRNSWLNGRMYLAHSGFVLLTIAPTMIPRTRPIRICWVSESPRVRGGSGTDAAGMGP